MARTFCGNYRIAEFGLSRFFFKPDNLMIGAGFNDPKAFGGMNRDGKRCHGHFGLMIEMKLDRVTVLLMALFMGLLMSTDLFMLPFFPRTLMFFLGFISIMAAAPMSASLAESLTDLLRDESYIDDPEGNKPDGSVYMMAASIGCILFAGFVTLAQTSLMPVV